MSRSDLGPAVAALAGNVGLAQRKLTSTWKEAHQDAEDVHRAVRAPEALLNQNGEHKI